MAIAMERLHLIAADYLERMVKAGVELPHRTPAVTILALSTSVDSDQGAELGRPPEVSDPATQRRFEALPAIASAA